MSSVVDEFVKTPSEELLRSCTKEQLVQLSEHYSIALTAEDKKLKDSLFKAVGHGLVTQGILVGPTSPVLSSANTSGSSERELKMKEFAYEERKLQLEAARIRSERESRYIKEKELQNVVEIKKLELQHQLDLKRLEQEERENEKKRDFQLQCDREERDFVLKKLELEIAARQSPAHASSSTSHHPSVPSLAQPVPLVDDSNVVATGDADTSPLHSLSPETAGASVPPASMLASLHTVNAAPDAHTSARPLLSDQTFDVSRSVRMVPPFNEREIEKYFVHFERVAVTLKWPIDMWCLLLASVLTGKAQSVYSSLSIEQSSDYYCVKSAILNAYELVPEAYRQKFRGL